LKRATPHTYAHNQRFALQRFLDDGRLPVHNNISGLNLRRQVVGRRNRLFVGSDDGAVTNTRFVSLLASGRLHDIELLSYIRDSWQNAGNLVRSEPAVVRFSSVFLCAPGVAGGAGQGGSRWGRRRACRMCGVRS
jgi:hypothetical protein